MGANLNSIHPVCHLLIQTTLSAATSRRLGRFFPSLLFTPVWLLLLIGLGHKRHSQAPPAAAGLESELLRRPDGPASCRRRLRPERLQTDVTCAPNVHGLISCLINDVVTNFTLSVSILI